MSKDNLPKKGRNYVQQDNFEVPCYTPPINSLLGFPRFTAARNLVFGLTFDARKMTFKVVIKFLNFIFYSIN